MYKKRSLIFFAMIFFNFLSCVRLKYDDTIAYPLNIVSISKPPASEDVRDFVQLDDLVYTAAGSGGMLVYRIIGDSMQPELSLSLTNLYSEQLERIYIRTVEIVSSPYATNLVFSYDTILGGGIGVAQISPLATKTLGGLKTDPGLRIRKTITKYNPEGFFHILVANEGVGVMSYDISFVSNSFFENTNISSLLTYISSNIVDSPVKIFAALDAPSLEMITNISQITNIDVLIKLALENPKMFDSIISKIPFLTKEQRAQINKIIAFKNRTEVSEILETARSFVGDDLLNKVMQKPNLLNNNLSNININNVQNISSDIPDPNISLSDSELDLKNDDVSNEIEKSLNDITNNSLFKDRIIGDAATEIRKTIQGLGRRFLIQKDDTLKQKLKELSEDELKILFSSMFQQVAFTSQLIPLFDVTGIDIHKLYTLWKEENYSEIIEILDSSIIAELLRFLPEYRIQTVFQVQSTNILLPSLRHMNGDEKCLYLAAGFNGFFIVDRKTGKILSSKQKEFSEVTSVIPYEVFNKKYIVVTDALDGLVMYERKYNKIGNFVTRVPLVGEAFSIFPYEDLLWVADGSNGVLGVRYNKNQSFTIESEIYDKKGFAYFVGAGRRREVLASYGSQGLIRVRMTNILPESIQKSDLKEDKSSKRKKKKDDFIDQTLEWGLNSRFALFLKRVLFL